MTRVLLLAALAVVLLYGGLLAALWRTSRTVELGGAARLLPDVLRLLRDLARDKALGRGTRTRVALLLLYLANPLDLVPDVIPVLGVADDLLAVALVLRSVVRRAGPQSLEQHWSGTPDGLAVVRRLAGLA